ncbi:hypothetical protein BDA99DRAFT_509414 [Phascolomyces articulosus]|uniref:Uncharacterized protein n=1 Tax=Phascolomyces articulosus TaxID=60185 RepID=A0AAD5KA65_9FUNG|nr:hypothetical protein BDA99DRAFT_509414 [Phascolomyces articulosus]
MVFICCSTGFILIDLAHNLTHPCIIHIQFFIMTWCPRFIHISILYYPFFASCCVLFRHIIRSIIILLLFPIQGYSSLFMHVSKVISICPLVIILFKMFYRGRRNASINSNNPSIMIRFIPGPH